MEILQSNIGRCGAAYKVKKDTKDGTYKPGSLGLISFVKGKDMDYGNIVYFYVITTRRGKGGKQRLDFNELSCPVFDTDNIVKLSEKKEYMPALDRRYYVLLKLLPQSFDDIQNMGAHDYLAWACCQAKYLDKLRSRINRFSMWPKSGDHIMNIIKSMDHYLGNDFSEEQKQGTIEQYSSPGMREQFLQNMRKLACSMVQGHIGYKQRVAKIELDAATHIFKNVSAFGVTKKLADATYRHHKDKLTKISYLLDKQKSNKRAANKKLF